MTTTTIDQTTHKLFTHLWRGGQFAYFWTAPARQSYWFPVGQLPPIPTGEAVYFGVNPVGAIPTANSKGEAKAPEYVRSQVSHIAAVNALFAEFDIKDYGTSEAIHDHLKQYPSPTVKIFSGGGYHCYWLLDDPLIIADDAARQRASEAQARWVDFVGGDKAAKDLARVLRVPGTLNRKPEYGPNFPTVEVVEADFSLTWPIVNLEAMSRPAAKPMPGNTAPKNGPTPTDDSERAAELLDRLDSYRADDYHEWLKVGMSLSGLGSAGLDLWDSWSRQSPKYEAGVCAEKWPTFTPDGVGFGSLVFMAAQDDPRPQASNGNGSHPDPVATVLPVAPPGDDDRPVFECLSFAELLRRPPKQWLIKNVIGAGDLFMFFGDAGSGKTFTALDLLAAAGVGRAFADKFETHRPLRAAYCAGEGLGGLPNRAAAVLNKYHLAPGDMPISFYTDVPQLFDESQLKNIYTFISEIKQSGREYDIVIFDTLHASTIGANENATDDMGVVIGAMKHARDMLGCSVGVVHHANKSGSYRGSTSLHGAMDTILQTKLDSEGIGTLECFKQKDAPKFAPVYFRLDSEHVSQSAYVQWLDREVINLNSEQTKLQKAVERIPDLLTTEPGLNQTGIINRMPGFGRNTILDAIKGLETEGRIKSESIGVSKCYETV